MNKSLKRAIRREKCQRLARRDGRRCWWCNWPFAPDLSDATLDHIASRHAWASWHDDSLVLACGVCNELRGAMAHCGDFPIPNRDDVMRVYATVLLSLSWQTSRGHSELVNGGCARAYLRLALRWLCARGIANQVPPQRREDDPAWRTTPFGAVLGVILVHNVRPVPWLTRAFKLPELHVLCKQYAGEAWYGADRASAEKVAGLVDAALDGQR